MLGYMVRALEFKRARVHVGLYNNPPPKNVVKPRPWSRDCCREPKKR